METNISVTKAPYEIRFGERQAGSTFHNSISYLFVGPRDNASLDRAGATNHHIGTLVDSIHTLLDRLDGRSATALAFGADSLEMAFMVFGQECREQYDAQSLQTMLNPGAGTKQFATRYGATYDALFRPLWPFISEDLSEYLGGVKWSRLQNRNIDNMLAGIFVVARFVSTQMTLWFHSIGEILNDAVQYDSADNIGIYTPFNPRDKSTWGSAIFDLGILGFTDASYVNDPDLRAYTVPVVDIDVEAILGKSTWTWRFGREKTVKPIWYPQHPRAGTGVGENTVNKQMSIYTDYGADGAETVRFRPFLDSDTNDHNARYLLNQYKEMVTRLRAQWVENRAMVPLKEMWTDKKIIDLRIGDGPAGLMYWQQIVYEHDADGRDTFSHASDVFGAGTATLFNVERRDTVEATTGVYSDYWFEVIGEDVELDHWRMLYGMLCDTVEGNSMGESITGCVQAGSPLSIHGVMTFGIDKDEFGEYLLATAVGDLLDYENIQFATATTAYPMEVNVKSGAALLTPDNIAFHSDVADTAYIKFIDTAYKHFFFQQRAHNPYKKLKHMLYDVNELDIKRVSASVVKWFWSTGKVSPRDGFDSSSTPWDVATGAPPSEKEVADKKKKENKEKIKKEREEKEKKKDIATGAPGIKDKITDASDLDSATGAPPKREFSGEEDGLDQDEDA